MNKTFGKKAGVQILFLLLGLAFLVCGVMRGEADTVLIAGMGGALMVRILTEGTRALMGVRELVLNKAIKLCLECVGIG